MSIAVELPALGESVVEGTVSKWLVKEGDRVEVDEPLVEVTTDKVDAEIPAPASGVVEQLLVSEGETLAVGQPLLLLATVAETFAPTAAAPPPGEGPGPPATPVARRLAAEAQVDLRSVEGTGPSGRVTKHDLQRHAATDGAGPVAAAEPARAREPGHPAFLHYALQSGDRVIPMSPLRRLVAEHMVLSKRVSPHVGTVAEVDMGDVVRVRDAHKRAFLETHGFRLSFLPFVIHATVRALREFPGLNASVLEDAIVEKGDIHIGVAVETDKGLVVPVLRHADRLSIAGLAQAVQDLAVRARSKKLSADELQGGTFTVSNPGRRGNLYGFAIINQPQVGILRLGEIVKRPVVRTVAGQDAIAIRPLMHLALSYDHRAVDGAPANGFLFRVRQLLEEAEFDL
jgi:2-oxoglutarate dehydrogenase E2 component (dihydrolipoamide succinyltransferase)